MSITPEAIRLMAESGLDSFKIAEIAEALKPDRSSAAERQARYRQRKKAKKEVRKAKEAEPQAAPDNERDVTRDVTPPNDIYSNPPASPSLANANDAPPKFSDRFLAEWNETAKRCGMREARPLTGSRLTKLRARVREYGEDAVLEAVKRLSTSKFHCGENDRGWRADIGWLIRNGENIAKALEFDLPKTAATARQANPELKALHAKWQAGEITAAEFDRQRDALVRRAA